MSVYSNNIKGEKNLAQIILENQSVFLCTGKQGVDIHEL